MSIDKSAVPDAKELLAEGVLEIHARKNGQTVILTARVKAVYERPFSPPGSTHSLDLELVGAGFMTAVDGRLVRQQESIDRLMAHLRMHCPEMRTGHSSPCAFMEEWRNEHA